MTEQLCCRSSGTFARTNSLIAPVDLLRLECLKMRELLKNLLKDQNGMILSSEVVLIGTILVLGSIAGLAAISHAVNNELNDIANAYQATNMYGNADQNSDHTTGPSDGYYITDSKGIPEVAGY